MKTLEVAFILCLYSIASGADKSTISALNSIDALYHLQSNLNRTDETKPEQIIMDRQIVTHENTPSVIAVTSATVFECELKKFVFENSKVIYTVLKCKYSNLLIATFLDLFDCVALCNNSTQLAPLENDEKSSDDRGKCAAYIAEKLISFKEYIAKMIFNLMYFMTIYPSLKSTDHTLIKCLISVNLFLHNLKIKFEKNSVNKTEFPSNVHSEIVTKKVIAQIINLIEVFNCKHCYVQNANLNFYIPVIDNNIDMTRLNNDHCHDVVDKLVLAKIEEFKWLFINSMSVEKMLDSKVINFNVTMYDPGYFLLENIVLEVEKKYPFFATLKVLWNRNGDWQELKRAYEESSQNYDIKVMFDRQVLLFEVIKDVFYVKLVDIYGNGGKVNDSNVIGVFKAFCRFVNDMLPTNYPTRLYGPIVEVKNALFYDLQIAKPSDGAVFSEKTVRLLLKKPVIKTWGESNDVYREINETDASELVESVLGLQSFDHFVRIFELLSYESNALDDYRLHAVENDNAHAENGREGRATCDHLTGLREVLVAFQILIDGGQRAVAEDGGIAKKLMDHSLGAAILAVRKSIVFFSDAYGGDEKIGRVLLPLLIRFPESTENFGGAARFLTTRQMTTLALNQLENCASRECASPAFNREMYRRITSDKSLYRPFGGDGPFLPVFYAYGRQLSAEVQRRAAKYRIGAVRETFYSTSVKELVPDTKTLHGDEVDWDEYIWNGDFVPVDQAYAGVSLSVIDYQYLVRFQLFEMKWVVSRVFKTLSLVLSGDGYTSKNHNLSYIATDVQRFKDLPFPESVRTYVRSTLDACAVALEKWDERVSSLCQNEIFRQLEAMSMSTEDFPSSLSELRNVHSISKLCASFHADIDRLKRILGQIDKSNLINELEFSSALY